MEETIMRKSLFIGLVAILGLIGCSRNQEIDVPDANLSIFAKTESPAETKTLVESGVHVYWEPGDEIAVFTGEQSAKFTTDITAASGTATFKGTFGDATWPDDLDLWAVYPFSEEAVFDGETITTTLPSEQVAREGSFGKDMNLAIAHSNSSTLQFYNVGGGIRFSVTEEGIKKAMFEGLSGEIISGKVKIGMDENGKPEVREVTGGSQFITLLPPTGQETFEPGAWYYIVAIPGSLEGGYKMRFYKDEDYARKVSEKTVVIKRSVFGNVEKADEGIEYEATTTKFPETEEEWSKSVQLTEEATDEITRIVFTDNNNRSIEELVDAVQKVDGVINVKMNSDASVMMVLQRDSIWINVLLKEFSSQEEIEPQTETANSIPMASPRANLGAQDSGTELSSILKEESFFPKRDSALIFAPFEDANENIDDWVKILNRIFKKVRVLKNDQASIEYCKEEVLSRYDYIIFSTHGIDGYYLYFKGIFDFQNIKTGYCLCTGTRYTIGGLEAGRLFINEGFRPEELCVTLRSNGKRYFGVTSQFFQRKLLQDKVFILSACSSAFNINNSSEDDPNGSIMRALLNNGARLVAGTRDSVYPSVSGTLNKYLLLYMEQGLSFQTAYEYIQHSEKTKKAMDELNTWVTPDPEYIHWDLGNNYMYIPNPNTNNEPYFFIDPFPTALKDDDDISGSVYTRDLSWDCNLKTFEIEWFDTIYESSGKKRWKMKYYTYSVHYDVYINGELAVPELILKKTKWTAPAPGKYDWYVVAKIIEGSTVIASYQSGINSFIIKDETPVEPEAIDLGLSVKWASFNLGATKPEEYGDYYAWGETEPYYSSLDPLVWKPEKQYGYNWMHYKWAMGSETTLTKYCSDAAYGYNGFTDGKITLDPEDDAAQVNLGDKWRMPTDKEWEELTSNCSFVWTQQNSVGGFTVTSKKPGFTDKSIFIPAAGVWFWQSLNSADSEGYYWSLTGYRDSQTCSYGFWFNSSSPGCCSLDRCYGFAIRPVYGDRKTTPSGDIEGTEEDPWN